MPEEVLALDETPDWVDRLKQRDLAAIEWLLVRHRDDLRRMAREQCRRYALCEADCDEDDAVNGAFAALWELAGTGDLEPITMRDGYWRTMRRLLHRQVRLAWARLRRKRRGGPGVGRTGRLRSDGERGGGRPAGPVIPRQRGVAEVDEERLSIPSGSSPWTTPMSFERLKALLPDEIHREVLVLIRDGSTEESIARRLGVNVRTIRRKVARIRGLMRECGFMT